MSEESPSKNKGIDKKFFKLSTTSSLPLVLNDVCVLRSEPGMDILARSSALGQYHNPHLPHNIHNFHHHTDQTKSLQELQNEVGALLEFRDLVIETFPDLKHKMASSGANSTITGIPTLSSIVSRREWEPGIRVRRKLNNNQKEGSNSSSGGGSAGEIIQSTSLLTRSRSNSHSGKKELKSGEGNVSVVQDSGFSSSSKDAHSATSNNNNNSSTLSGRLGSTENSASENELWNLLDVIQRRTARVSDEIGHYHEFEKKKRLEDTLKKSPSVHPQESITFHTNLYHLSKDSVRLLQKERDNMMDKMGDLEAECHYRRIKESNFQQQLDEMQQTKFNLEQQVKSSTSRNHIIPILPELPRKLETNTSKHQMKSTELLPTSFQGPSNNVKPLKNELGHLDFLFSSPNSKINKVRQPDSKKIAAILLETNVIELQRHLLTITVHNQVLQQRLENSTRSKNYLIKQLDKSKDDIDDLKFQIQERNIELEGTLAQLRVIETKLGNRNESANAEHLSGSVASLMHHPNNSLQQQNGNGNGNVLQQQTTISTPSMKAMIPLAMDEIFQHSSSTESATHFDDQHDHDIVMTKYPETPKRSKPSKIPLPGSKGYIAKPPTGRNCANPGPPSNSNRSLTKSTGSLFVKYTESPSIPKSSIKDISITVANDSVHSWRNLSFDGKSRSSSIPISKPVLLNVTLSPGKSSSAGISPNTNKYVASSYRRDSLKLTRLQSASTTTLNPMRSSSTSNNIAPIVSNSNSNRKSTALPVRRLSHNSNNDISDLPADQNVNTNETNGAKVQQIWNFDQSDKTKEDTDFVIDLKQSTEECSVKKSKNTKLLSNFSYKNIPVGDL